MISWRSAQSLLILCNTSLHDNKGPSLWKVKFAKIHFETAFEAGYREPNFYQVAHLYFQCQCIYQTWQFYFVLPSSFRVLFCCVSSGHHGLQSKIRSVMTDMHTTVKTPPNVPEILKRAYPLLITYVFKVTSYANEEGHINHIDYVTLSTNCWSSLHLVHFEIVMILHTSYALWFKIM